eukprot:GILJ01001862.1.p1 GENE.GILJ01001862.1~~GILJ01001862.1.p1  ORF type:complete len:355 (+),score=25.94 GILJ01001862.1:51-1067(+)
MVVAEVVLQAANEWSCEYLEDMEQFKLSLMDDITDGYQKLLGLARKLFTSVDECQLVTCPFTRKIYSNRRTRMEAEFLDHSHSFLRCLSKDYTYLSIGSGRLLTDLVLLSKLFLSGHSNCSTVELVDLGFLRLFDLKQGQVDNHITLTAANASSSVAAKCIFEFFQYFSLLCGTLKPFRLFIYSSYDEYIRSSSHSPDISCIIDTPLAFDPETRNLDELLHKTASRSLVYIVQNDSAVDINLSKAESEHPFKYRWQPIRCERLGSEQTRVIYMREAQGVASPSSLCNDLSVLERPLYIERSYHKGTCRSYVMVKQNDNTQDGTSTAASLCVICSILNE